MVIDYLAYSMEDMVTIFIKVDEKRHPLDEALAHYLASKKSIDQSLKRPSTPNATQLCHSHF
jgi:hypothetical protein